MKPLHKIFLISFLTLNFTHAFAQFKVEVKNLQDVVTHGGEFKTLPEAESWADRESKNESWGKNERLVPLEGASDEDRALAIEVIPANGSLGDINYSPSMLRVRKTYSYTITDVTAQRQAEKALALAMASAQKAMECGRSTQALLLVRNSSKNLSTSQVKTLVAAYSSIKQLLDTGSLQSSIEEIQAVEADGVIITESDKSALVDHINNCKPQ